MFGGGEDSSDEDVAPTRAWSEAKDIVWGVLDTMALSDAPVSLGDVAAFGVGALLVVFELFNCTMTGGGILESPRSL